MKGTVQEDEYTFLIIPSSFLTKMKYFADDICRETRNTHFLSKPFYTG
jgi:hypothetical protein